MNARMLVLSVWVPTAGGALVPCPVGAEGEPEPKGAVKIGDKVPAFSFRPLDGKSVKLSELQRDEKRTKTGVVVLSFWCSTCHSCRHVEHPLSKLAKDYE